jgi:hypothetical protein
LSALSEVLTEFARRGISMRMVGTAVKLSPKAALDTKLLARARAVKGEIVRMLSARPETCSKECYEVERGRWIHRPWSGCTTSQAIAAEAPRQMDELVCWHCLGTKRCNCASGCHELDDTCRVCRGSGRVRGWVQ